MANIDYRLLPYAARMLQHIVWAAYEQRPPPGSQSAIINLFLASSMKNSRLAPAAP